MDITVLLLVGGATRPCALFITGQFGKNTGWCPMERLDPITQPQKEPRPLAEEDVTKIFQAIPPAKLRDRVLFTLLYETAVCVGELSGVGFFQGKEK